MPAKARAYVNDYCKRNGLLTLSVIAVVTGCVLGFLLRSFNLSTQVWMRTQHQLAFLSYIALVESVGILNIVLIYHSGSNSQSLPFVC